MIGFGANLLANQSTSQFGASSSRAAIDDATVGRLACQRAFDEFAQILDRILVEKVPERDLVEKIGTEHACLESLHGLFEI